ncbi:MAG: glycosyltransferase [Maritimibacter sp.]|nr:glycosyltransferase [Maritimibacter sp.]
MNGDEPQDRKTGLRIALAPGTIDGGGIGTAMLNLAQGLVEGGARVDLLLTAAPKDGRAVPKGVALHVLGPRTRRAFGAARRYLIDARPDMVITARNTMHLLIAATLKTAGRRGCLHVWTFHTHRSTELTRASAKDRLVDWLAIRAIGSADRLVAVSRGVAEDIERGAGLAPGSVETIPNAAWDPAFLARAAAPCPHPWLEDGGPPVILGIGRLVPQKDFPTLLRAVAGLDRPARLAILGEGRDRAELEALVAELGLGERVILPGQVSNIFAWLARADLFVLSSRWEGFGMVLVEALGCGTPAISTDCPSGPADILDNGKRGALVPVGDVAALTSAIADSLAAPRPDHRSAAEAYRFRDVARRFEALRDRTS